MSRHETACPLDCPDACTLEVHVEEGRVRRIEGTRRNPLTAGFICSKVRDFDRRLYGPERLLHPLVRAGAKGEGRFERVGWDAALDRVAAELGAIRDRFGGEAVLPLCYGGSNGKLTQDAHDARFFGRLGASRLARTVCAAATGRAHAGLYGKLPGVGLSDYAHAALVVVWGANPSASNIHLVPILKAARRRGAKLVVVDPRRTQLARAADLHLAPRPGTDLPLALAVVRELFETGAADRAFLEGHATGADELRRRAGEWTLERAAAEADVPVEDLARFARLYAATRPAVLRCGWGLERNRNGGSAVAAVLALPAVAGHFGVRGSGFTLSNSAAWSLDPERAAGAPAPATRTVNMNRTGEALLELDDPPVRALFVYNANPLATLPAQERVRRGLERADLFTVVFDQVLTDTARYADVVLPATTFLEHAELSAGYGAYVLNRIDPVIEPVGEARPNGAVFAELCRRMGLEREGDARTPEEVRDRILRAAPGGEDLARRLAAGELVEPPFGGGPVQFVDVFPATPDGRIRLVPEELDREAPDGLYAYRSDPEDGRDGALALISPATRRTISSSLGEAHRDAARVELHPADAAARAIEDGAPVRVFNELGEVHCLASVSEDLRPGVALLPKGLWSHNTANGRTANALAPDTLTDLGGGACFNDARVRVEPRAG